MTLSVLAILFLAVMIAVAVVGMRLLGGGPRPGDGSAPPDAERCALCRQRFSKSDLVLRQVGDYKLLYFCRECVLKLYADLGLKN